jgi:hypothetical protein
LNTRAKPIIADNLSKAGWSWGCVSTIDSNGRTIWIVDAHRENGKRFIAHADEKLTAFLEPSGNSSCRLSPFFSFTLQHFAADNIKAGAASTAADKELATFGNGIFCVVVAFLRMLPNGRPHRLVLVHVVNVHL